MQTVKLSKNKSRKPIIIIGGGLAGLSAAYLLSRQGYPVTIVEKSSTPGGLASSISIQGEIVERFYHFICQTDHHLINLANELGISSKLHWQATKTSFYHEGRLYPFGTPWNLLNFSAVPLVQRLRFGLHIIFSRYRNDWRTLDRYSGKEWLIKNIGEKAYYVIWHPLLKIKFGEDYEKISAAWIWHRIWRVAKSRKRLLDPEQFGYFEQGSFTLIDALINKLKEHGVNFIYGKSIDDISIRNNKVEAVILDQETFPCQAVISTIALPNLTRILPEQSDDYFIKIKEIKYIGVVCVLLNLKQPFSKVFWTNTNDPRIPFNGFIEQTNLNVHYQKKNLNLLYIPYYLDTKEPRYQFSNDDLYNEYIEALRIINPIFDQGWIKDKFVFRDPYAQAICTTNFVDQVPAIKSPIQGLFITDSAQFYPEDRTLNSAIDTGFKAARLIMEDLQ